MSDAAIADRRVHPATVALRFVKELPSTIIGFPAAYALFSDAGLFQALGVVGGSALAMLLLNWLAWRRFRYGVGSTEIVIESGILSRNRRSIPFDRIQDVDIEQRLLQRLFGLAKVRIETGGSAADEGLLDSVTLAEADRLRAAVRAGRSEAAEPSELAQAEPRERTIFAMDLPRVLVSGAYNFSLFYLAALFALLQQFDDWLPFDIYDPARWAGFAEAGSGRFTPAAAAALLIVALLLGIPTGIIRTLLRDYGFRLVAEGRRLRRVRGLLTRSEVVVPMARVQLGSVETGPIRRLGGWFALSFQTLGGSGEPGTGGGSQTVAPFAKLGEMRAILAEEGRLAMPGATPLERVSRRHALRIALVTVTLPLAAILVLSWFNPPLLAALAVLPLLARAAVLQRLFHRYALVGDLLYIARGWWRQRLSIVPVGSAQALTLSRSPLQRLLGLATLSIDTAGAPAMNGARIVDLPAPRARELDGTLSAGLRRRA